MTTLFSVLAEPNRQHIIELIRVKPMAVNEIVERLQLKQPLVSKHLRILSEAGIVVARPLAHQRIYALKPEAFRELGDWLSIFDQYWNAQFDALDRYIEESERSKT